MSFMNFFQELKRRNVYKVAMAYGVTAWLIAQMAGLAAGSFEAPSWVMKMVIVVLVIGFPIALILAWAFEMSPQGVVRTTSNTIKGKSIENKKNKFKVSNLLIGFLLLIIIGQFIYNNYWNSRNWDHAIIEQSIAVLPFSNESSNQENQYFCNGVMNAIILHLSKIEDLRVVPRTSVERYRDHSASTKEIGEELNVGYILYGSVQRYEEKAIIFVNLIDAQNERQIWSHKYDKELSEIFFVQAEITQSIAQNLQTLIAPDLRERINAIPTPDPLAYDHYLQGNEYLFEANSMIQTNDVWKVLLDKAKLSYELALNRDSTFSEAFLGLAWVEYKKQKDASFLEDDYLSEVLKILNIAVRLNPDLGEIYFLRSIYYSENNKPELAKKDIEKALSLNPNDIDALYRQVDLYSDDDLDFLKAAKTLQRIEKRISTKDELTQLYLQYCFLYHKIGDIQMLEVYFHKCSELNPDEPNVFNYIYNITGRFQVNIDYLNQNYPDNQYKFGRLGGAHLYNGEIEKSVENFRKWEELVDIESVDNWLSFTDWHRYGQAIYLNGEKEKGREMMMKQIKINESKVALARAIDLTSPMYDLAGIYSFLSESDSSYFWLEKFHDENGWLRSGYLSAFIKYDPQFDNISDDEKFNEILKLAEAQQRKVQMEVREVFNLEE